MMAGLRVLAGALAMMGALSPAGAALSAPLKGLEPGEWELRERVGEGEKGEVRRICMADIRQMIQLRHSRNPCKRLTVDEAKDRLSVSYECAAGGSGRTDLRIETSRLVQIRAQGVADGAPFSLTMEGRRLGPCQ